MRAARDRLGWSQARAAQECGVVLGSFVRWDRGSAKPRDPTTAQQLSEGLRTPIDVLWPPEDNPVAATALQAIRSRRASEDTEPEPRTLAAPDHAPLPERPSPDVPDVLDVLQTIDGAGAARRPRFAGRRLAAVAAALVIVAAAVLVVVSGGSDDHAPTTAAITTPRPSTSTVDSARLARVAEMTAAADRGDYNAAIAAADELNDPAAARYRAEAAAVLVRRAGTAAKRGDLSLARQRLRAAKRRYDTAPGGAAVEAQIRRIERARAERATKRRAEREAAQRREQERRAAAAAATAERSSATTTSGGASGADESASSGSAAAQQQSSATPSPKPTPKPKPEANDEFGFLGD